MLDLKNIKSQISATQVPSSQSQASTGLMAQRARLKNLLRRNIPFFLLALPGLALIILFYYYTLPFLVIAFKDYRIADGLWGSQWVGLKNFMFLFGSAGKGWQIVRNVVLYNLAFISLGTVLALTVAILLAEVHKSRAVKYYQTALFFPQFISWVIIAYVAYAFLHKDNGLLNAVILFFGGKPVDFYNTASAWPAILITAHIWRSLGSGAVIYLAGILRINPEYFEAAQVDGASKWQQIRYITLPSLVPLVIILTLLAIGNIFRADFGLFYQVPRQYLNPGLIRTTDVIDTYVVRALQQGGSLELAAAAGLYQSTVGFVLILTVNWIVRRIDPERSLF